MKRFSRKFLVCAFNLIFVLPLLVWVIIGALAKIITMTVDTSFNIVINPIRSGLYSWAFKKCRLCHRKHGCPIKATKAINGNGCSLYKKEVELI